MSEWIPIENLNPNLGDKKIGRIPGIEFCCALSMIWTGERWSSIIGFINPTHYIDMPEMPPIEHCCEKGGTRCVEGNKSFRVEEKRGKWDDSYQYYFVTSCDYCPFCGEKFE